MEDEALRPQATGFHEDMLEELADFAAYFPGATAAWLAAFQQDIDTAAQLPSDRHLMNTQKIYAADVKTELSRCYRELQQLNNYAQEAYAEDAAKQAVFGLKQWGAARTNAAKMQAALLLAHELAGSAAYSADLLAAGYPAAALAQLPTLAAALNTANVIYQEFKKNRPVRTRQRIAASNTVWEHMSRINNMAQVVHQNDPARLGRYRLYGSDTK